MATGSDIKPRDIHLHSAQPKTKFEFNIDKPIKYGFLRKQGQKLKVMKERFVVVYPGFLVYYSDATKWKFDLTVGTLQSRNKAVKLNGGNVGSMRGDQVSGDVKFPFNLYAPDVANDRQGYLFDATSTEERDSWIAAIKKGIPEKKDSDKK